MKLPLRVSPGVTSMIIASMMYTLMVAFVKVVREELDVMNVVMWRAVLSAPLAALYTRKAGFHVPNPKAMLMRVVLGFISMSCLYTAAHGLALTDISLIAKLQPIIVASLAPIFLGTHERSGIRLWIVIFVGLLGSALVIGPSLSFGSWYGLWALGFALGSALTHLTVRYLGRTTAPMTIVFWFQIGLLGFSLASIFASGNAPLLPSTTMWPYVVGLGVSSLLGQTFMTRAYTMERAAVVATASYSGPLFALLFDIVLFSAVPSLSVIFGGLLIIGVGVALAFSSSPKPGSHLRF